MNIANMFNHTLPESILPSDHFVLPDCYIGVEIELESFLQYRRFPRHHYNFIKIIGDNSLRDNGRELVFKRPLRGLDLESGIEELSSNLDNTSYKKSWRCSTHIHLDVRDLDTIEYQKLVLVNSILEPTLFTMEPTRVDNPYCVPYSKLVSNISVVSILNSLFSDRFSELEYFPKYSSINLNATHKYGSMEYRVFEPMDDIPKLVNYINMIMLAKKIAIDNSVITPELVYSIYKEVLDINMTKDTESYDTLMYIKDSNNIGVSEDQYNISSMYIDDFEIVESGIDMNTSDEPDEPDEPDELDIIL